MSSVKRPGLSRRGLFANASAVALLAAGAVATGAAAQDGAATGEGDVVIVTGTRIQDPNLVAASPINTVGQAEISRQFTPNLERVFRDLPITIPGDGENVNNGTEGAATVDLRGLGPERSLVLMDGKRLVPFSESGTADINQIPLNMIERVDIITGGASAVYGSDAMSGAINFITRKNFEGVEFGAMYSLTEQGDGDTYDISALFGSNLGDGRGNVTASVNYTMRSGVLLGDRDFGLVGVDTATGSGRDGQIVPAPAECDAPGSVAVGGSTTAIPGALDLPGGTLQFRNDGTLGPRCSVFNFNPFNYYQTPQERFGLTAIGHYELTDNIEAYFRGTFNTINVRQQVAPSGVFGNRFDIPLQNPFLSAQARQAIIDNVNSVLPPALGGTNAGSTATFETTGVLDLNNNGVFDLDDAINVPVRRRTLELGTRSEDYDTSSFQFVVGLRGQLPALLEGWDYDLSFQYGENERTRFRAGYTNVANIATALNTVSADECRTPDGVVTQGCVPINIFGGFGSITPEAAQFNQAVAFLTQGATQAVVHGSVSGPVDNFVSPWAQTPLNLAFGMEYRKETGFVEPDECLKLPPVSCQGGAGGNVLPIKSEYRAFDGFVEAIMPVIQNRPMFEAFTIEAGYRYSDFDPTEDTSSWKAGVNWQVTPSFRVRYMEQQAVRTPNIEEIGSPIVTGLDNATFDPCSSGNPNPITPELIARCEATGVPAGQTGLINDIVAGQVNLFTGTDPNNLPGAETARTRTAGIVWRPDMSIIGGAVTATTLSVDYYRIRIEDYIDTLSGDELFTLCYTLGDEATCNGIVRDNAGLITSAGTGLPAFFQNLDVFQASGVEIGLNTGYDFGDWGQLDLTFNANRYLSNEFQSTDFSALVDCNGGYSTSCDPVPKFRSVTRLTWFNGPYDVSVLWRRIGSMDFVGTEEQKADVFDAFEHIDAFNYFDLSFGWSITESLRLGGAVKNVTNQDPPIIGNDTGSTSFNSGNTFPSLYDVNGRVYSLSIKASF
ncbi:TonB-dependent receptor plug domain-containing protein [Amphiplicatus metriothermophilus]|uniref:TonB-dependent Receptor Plug Domain n=1 Tax=Amphiplicatus metriothermophilus TaxID=1519374 RepID=A0A239PT41_9PROT|nr:TonB-dependent receptor [Amphiplicatus metriothermophilus]MBB5519229.1 outer membrane receptor protein involved in Fe transport [Amphiplicatus metriothermophilus]SNT73298.1 TonB-dependent Receptor Plug Domain [Amphiplicatus metriothermophilus]